MSFGKYLAKLNPANKGTLPRVVETVEGGLASAAVGYFQNKYRGKAAVAGVPLDLLGGGVAKAAGLAVDLFGGSKWSHGWRATAHSQSHLLGNVGVWAFMHTVGAGMGAKASGRVRLSIPKGDLDKARKALPNADVIGDIAQAPTGDALSRSDLQSLTRG